MAQGTRGRGDDDVRNALERCLSRMRRGESLDRCLADFSSLSDELRPLLQLAESIREHVIESPPNAEALDNARSRFLDAAGVVREQSEQAAAAAESLTPDEQAAAAALDGALAALARGASTVDALNSYPEHAETLRPLLEVAASVNLSMITPPTPPTRLARGRDRLWAAAADARDAAEREAAHADGDASLADAVDTCVARLAAGASVDQVLEAHPRQSHDLLPIASIAARMHESVVPPPPPDLTKGRQAMLAAARESRTAPLGIMQRLSHALSPGRTLSVARLVAAAIVLALVMGGGGMALAPAAASSLPGDSLYSVKRVGEQVRLALAFDPNSREQLEADYSRERDREIDALVSAGRAGEVDRWQVRFRGFEDQSDDRGMRHGVLHVVLLDDPETSRSLQWDEDTSFDLPDRYDSWSDVPTGVRLVVKVLIRSDGSPLALSVQMKESDDPDETPTPAGSPTAEGTSLPLATETAPATPTATSVTPTATATKLAATVTPTATEPTTPTATATTVSGAPSVEVQLRATLRGVLEAKTSDTTWLMVEEPRDRSDDTIGTKVPVDVSAIEKSDRERVQPGDWVQLHGRWHDDKRALFLARSIDRVRSSAGAAPERQCTMHTAVGRIASIDGHASITLVDGLVYGTANVPADVISTLKTGARVEITYQDCGNGERDAVTIHVLDHPSVGVYQGTVHEPTDSSFLLVTRRGSQYQVVYDNGTPLIGATKLEDGQFVQVRGWEDEDNSVIHALEIRVQSQATETPAATASVPPTPAATATGVATGAVPTAVPATATRSWMPEGTPTPNSIRPGEVPPTVQVNR